MRQSTLPRACMAAWAVVWAVAVVQVKLHTCTRSMVWDPGSVAFLMSQRALHAWNAFTPTRRWRRTCITIKCAASVLRAETCRVMLLLVLARKKTVDAKSIMIACSHRFRDKVLTSKKGGAVWSSSTMRSCTNFWWTGLRTAWICRHFRPSSRSLCSTRPFPGWTFAVLWPSLRILWRLRTRRPSTLTWMSSIRSLKSSWSLWRGHACECNVVRSAMTYSRTPSMRDAGACSSRSSSMASTQCLAWLGATECSCMPFQGGVV